MYPYWRRYVCIVNHIPNVLCPFDNTAVVVSGKVGAHYSG